MYQGVFSLKRRIEIIMAVVLLAAAAVIAPRSARYVMNMKAEMAETCICIDAGHGGDDRGKVGTQGTKEKEINLQIAIKLKKRLEKEGMKVVMTREDDADLADKKASSQKVSDMRNRVKIIEDADPVVTISIHQNSYTNSSVKGAQTFYYGESAEGKLLAETLQKSLIENLDPANYREAKANESYYLLKKTPTPTVIVECGFLSNPDEELKLQKEDYQGKIVDAICEGLLAYLR